MTQSDKKVQNKFSSQCNVLSAMLCAILIRGQARAAKPIPADENFESTEGLSLIWELTTQPYNYVFRSPDAELTRRPSMQLQRV